MALRFETFSNQTGGNCLFKALGHPLAARAAGPLLDRLARARRLAVYDPHGSVAALAELYNLSQLPVAHVFVQRVGDVGRTILGVAAQPVTDLAGADADLLLVAAFDADKLVGHIRHLIPARAEVVTLDALRLPDAMLSRRDRYLDPINFATNFAFFRDADGLHTRIATANYWARYGAAGARLWCALFGESGETLAEWEQALGAAEGAVSIDSAAVRRRFGLGEFRGQLFVHATGIVGHDTVKYALDTYSDDGVELSCTHDANSWPADFYAGLPAPDAGERVTLWVQNSHPCPIPAGAFGLNVMGREAVATLAAEVPPFGTRVIDVADLLPDARWPQQIEVRAGKHAVRPRYEILRTGGRRRIAHVNVERTDLAPDPAIADLANLLGKSFILPAPILPPARWRSVALPTPMATTQADLPIAAIVVDGSGRELARRRLGVLPRGHATAIDLTALAGDAGGLPSGFGHVELVYDFADGGGADGWLHGLFRYVDRESGHAADTSFGAHIFNTVMTFRNEPQSYSGPAPGLSTRLYLRVGAAPLDTLCHLIYPASTPWHAQSETEITLRDGDGNDVAQRRIAIPCGGSYLWRVNETFDRGERARAGDRAFVVVRDRICRLFGYHGLTNGHGAFSLDHMFGF
ncbi:MAG: hypothetical protein AB7F67_13895 [Rhodospirillaceae bacterium]